MLLVTLSQMVVTVKHIMKMLEITLSCTQRNPESEHSDLFQKIFLHEYLNSFRRFCKEKSIRQANEVFCQPSYF